MIPSLAKSAYRTAFSLVELSIVLVILGLLAGGILTGQSLIRAAQLRSIVSEYQTLRIAVNSFQEKYRQIPGDMRNATDFWGQMTNCGAASPSSAGTQTCNGDGDGAVEGPTAASRTGEMFGLWQHLANAGLLEGSYTGIAGSGGAMHCVAGVNVPESKFSGGAWGMRNITGYYVGNTTHFAGYYGNFYEFGPEGTTSTPQGSNLTPQEAWNIDTKIDDGKPNDGFLTNKRGCTNSTSATDTNATYLLDSNSQLCYLIFLDQF